MAFHNKNQRVAIGFYAVAALFIVIAFVSPYWLQSDGKLAEPKFLNLGKLSSRKKPKRNTGFSLHCIRCGKYRYGDEYILTITI